MKTSAVIVMCGSAFAALAAELDMDLLDAMGKDRTRWVAHSRGAEARECFRVVDSDGTAVSNASVCCAFKVSAGGSGFKSVYGDTDVNGLCTIIGTCKAYMDYCVEKDSFYSSCGKIDYMETHSVPAVIDGRWQPYGETRTVVLKRIKNPIRLRDPDARCRHKYPEPGKWTGFDLEVCDWVPPLGNGIHSDMQVRYTHELRPDGHFKALDVSFASSPYAGACLMTRDTYSEMDSVYEASTNAEYASVLRYEFERTAKGNHMISELGKDQYLIFRTRTKVDGDGNLVSAHYGRIMGDWQYVEKGGMSFGPVFFNSTPNDTNLEDAETARKSRLRYKQSKEQQGKRQSAF